MIFWFSPREIEDKPKWDWEKSGIFSVKSTYKHLCCNEYGPKLKNLWKAKVPLKIKIYMWLVLQDAILTKDNLIKRKWKGDTKCAFCPEKESVTHLFFECPSAKYVWSLLAFSLGTDCRPGDFNQYNFWIQKTLPQCPSMHFVGLAAVCWGIWRMRNDICFEKKQIKSPTEIVCLICSFLTYWTGLLKKDLQDQVSKGAEVVKKTALFFHGQDVMHAQDGYQLVKYSG